MNYGTNNWLTTFSAFSILLRTKNQDILFSVRIKSLKTDLKLHRNLNQLSLYYPFCASSVLTLLDKGIWGSVSVALYKSDRPV